MLAATPGASTFLLEGRTTYDRHSFLKACGVSDKETKGKSFSYGSPQAAGIAAKAALQQALLLSSMDDSLRTMPNTIGIGCASVLVSNSNSTTPTGTISRGKGTVVAVSADGLVLTLGIQMNQQRSRFQEELVLSHLVLRAAQLLQARQQLEECEHEYTIRSGDLVTERWEWSPTLSSLTIDGAVTTATSSTTCTNTNANGSTNTNMNTNTNTNTFAVVEEAARRVVDGGEDVVLLLPLYSATTATTTAAPIGIRALSQTVLPNNCLIFPGSFNPPHVGHLSLAKAAIRTLEILEPYVHPRRYNEKPILFELSLTNVDKPSIDPGVVASRVQKFLELAANKDDNDNDNSFPQQWAIVLTRAPLFEEKLRILSSKVLNRSGGAVGDNDPSSPGINFVIGTDTLVRILNPKYYRDESVENMNESLMELKERGARFVVGGRLEQGATTATANFVSGKEALVDLSEGVASMFSIMEESEFRVDLSSSEIRAQQEQNKEE